MEQVGQPIPEQGALAAAVGGPPQVVTGQAPVLLVPQVFEPEFCRHLIRIWETEGNAESVFMRQEADGTAVGVVDHAMKSRWDHVVQEGWTKEEIKRRLAERLVPEINKAFRFPVTRLEDLTIACYDAQRGGYFRAHRDNATAATAHRAFAMSLNLNAEEHEGGCLWFPEYAANLLYRPATGSAAVFSCSLLHEALDVTAGRRFVLLTFFYDEQGARIREEYSRRAGLGYRI